MAMRNRYTKDPLEIAESSLGRNHPDVANTLSNLGALYETQSRYAEAESMFKRSLAIVEGAFGSDHPDVVGRLSNLAVVYEREGRNDEAEQLLKRSLEISERLFDPSSRVVSQSLNNLAELYRIEARYADALPVVNRTIALNVASRQSRSEFYTGRKWRASSRRRKPWRPATRSNNAPGHRQQERQFQRWRCDSQRAPMSSHNWCARTRILPRKLNA
jgi:tetratricopeptide (TPR) repeat protein